MWYYETESNPKVQRWIQTHLNPEEKDHKIEVDNVHVPDKFAASTMIHFLLLLHQQNFAVEAHADFGDYVRVTNRRAYPGYSFQILVLKKLYSLNSKDRHDMLKIDDSDDDIPMKAKSPPAKRNLTADQVLDELEVIFGKTMMSIELAELLECDDIMDEVDDHRNEQDVILLNSEDSSYWCFSNITDIMDTTVITSGFLLSLLCRW